MNTVGEQLALLDAAIYGDLFDCAVTFEELWRYSGVRITPEDLAARLREPAMQQVLRRIDGFYCLAGREHLAGLRASRQQRARVLRRRSVRVARWLRHVPFVRGVLVTGSVAADSAPPDADVDLLVIVADGRLSSVFALLGSLSRLLSRRVLCPNYYLSSSHLTLRRRNHYVARELAQAEALIGEAGDLRAANLWISDHLPNFAGGAPAAALPQTSLAQRWLEAPLRGTLGDWLEAKARALTLSRLAVHHGLEKCPIPEDVAKQVAEGVEIRFHASPFAANLLLRHERRRSEIAAALAPHPTDRSEPSGPEAPSGARAIS